MWLYRNKKEVLTPPDEAVQKKLDRGYDIGLLAQKQFPGGVAVQNGWKNPQAAAAQTRELMARGVPAIYEAAFLYHDIFVLVDILQKTPGGWNIIEVKSSGKNINPIYLDDVSIQNYVVAKNGVSVEHCYLMHINTDYFQTTDETDWTQFFLRTQLDSELTPFAEIEQLSGEARPIFTPLMSECSRYTLPPAMVMPRKPFRLPDEPRKPPSTEKQKTPSLPLR